MSSPFFRVRLQGVHTCRRLDLCCDTWLLAAPPPYSSLLLLASGLLLRRYIALNSRDTEVDRRRAPGGTGAKYEGRDGSLLRTSTFQMHAQRVHLQSTYTSHGHAEGPHLLFLVAPEHLVCALAVDASDFADSGIALLRLA